MYVTYFKGYLNTLCCDLLSSESKHGFGHFYNERESNKYHYVPILFIFLMESADSTRIQKVL